MTGAGMPVVPTLCQPFLRLWQIEADGAPIETPTSTVLPVLHQGAPAMLKLLKPGSDEKDGIAALRHFAGASAVRLIEATDEAVLMERAVGGRSLTAMALGDADDEATVILARTASRLHAAGPPSPDTTIGPLRGRFRALFALRSEHPVLGRAAAMAEHLLAEPQRVAVLHADLHHENVLDSPRGFLAIDPKGAIGEATYDVANLFLNPAGVERLVLDQGRARRIAGLIAAETGFDPARIRHFAFAHAGLATAWNIEDGIDPRLGLALAEMLEPVETAR